MEKVRCMYAHTHTHTHTRPIFWSGDSEERRVRVGQWRRNRAAAHWENAFCSSTCYKREVSGKRHSDKKQLSNGQLRGFLDLKPVLARNKPERKKPQEDRFTSCLCISKSSANSISRGNYLTFKTAFSPNYLVLCTHVCGPPWKDSTQSIEAFEFNKRAASPRRTFLEIYVILGLQVIWR